MNQEILTNEEGEAYNISSARRYAAVTPHNTTTIDEFRGIYVGVGGDIKIGNADGDAIVFKNATAGTIIPVYGNLVYLTGTTATDLVALRG